MAQRNLLSPLDFIVDVIFGLRLLLSLGISYFFQGGVSISFPVTQCLKSAFLVLLIIFLVFSTGILSLVSLEVFLP